MIFNVILDRDEDGVWVIECPSIPGCFSQGTTRAEALENIRDAITLCLEARAELGMSLGAEDVFIDIDDFDREVARTRTNAKLMALLETRAKQTETVPLAEVKRRLGLE